MDLKNRITVVVGASGGMGSEIVKALKKEGVVVVEVSRTSQKYPCDLKNQDSIKKVTQQIIDDFGRVDILFNAAGIGVYTTLEESTLEGWNDSLSVNVTAPFLFSKYLLPALEKSEGAFVFLFGSGMGKFAHGNRIPYCTSKFALRGLSLSLTEEFKSTKIKFCLLTLGSVLTEFGPMTLEEKKEENLQGKAYLTPIWIAEKVVETLKKDLVEDEMEWYPTGYKEENT